MQESHIVEKLTRFGLEERQARVYYHLSRLGTATASEVAQATDVARTQVYDVMNQLEQTGFVESTLERPRTFVPHPLEDVLDQVLAEKQRRVEELEQEQEELVRRWPSLDRDPEASEERFSVHQGRSQIRGLLERMIDGAEDEVHIVARRRGLARLASINLAERLDRKAAEGVDVRILTKIEDPDHETFDRFSEIGPLRHANLPGYAKSITVDTAEIACFVSLDPLVSTTGQGETVLRLTAQDFILSQNALFDTLWSSAVPYEDRARELSSGEPARRLKPVRGRWMRYNRLQRMLYEAESTAWLALPSNDLEKLSESGLEAALERTAERGVDTVLLSPEPTDVEGIEVRVTDIENDIAMAVVDEERAFMGMGVREDPDSLTSQSEWGVWSTMPAMVEHVQREFEVRMGARARRADEVAEQV